MENLHRVWFEYVAGMLWQSSVVMAILLAVYYLSRKRSPVFRYAILCVVLVKFLLPPSFDLVIGLGNIMAAVQTRYTDLIKKEPPAPAFQRPEMRMPMFTGSERPNFSASARVVYEPVPMVAVKAPTDWWKIVFLAWAGTAAFLFMLHIFRLFRTRKVFGRTRPLQDQALLALLQEARMKIGVRQNVSLHTISNVHSPFVIGILRPRIVIPEDILKTFSVDELRPLIYHELGHVKRFDLLVNMLQIFLQILWFFHPGLWIMNHLIRTEREKACDDLALFYDTQKRTTYVEGMLKMLKNPVKIPWAVPGLLGLFEYRPDIVARIQRIMEGKNSPFPLMGIGEIILIAALALVILPLACTENKSPSVADQKKVSAATPQKPDRKSTTGISLNKGKPMTTKIDYSKLELKGNGHGQDHFSLTVQATARLLGLQADYDTIFALSTNPFAPCLDPGEPSKCWWVTTQGRDKELRLIAETIGLNVREITRDFSKVPPKPQDPAAEAQWLKEYYRKPWIPDIRQAQSQGEVLITCREWEVKGPHGYNPWCWWGAVVDTKDDGTILGACLNGYKDNPISHILQLTALSRGEEKLSARQAQLKLLEQAVHRIRGDAAPFLKTNREVFGLPAMDLWIAQMQQVPYCPECKDKSWICAQQTAQNVFEGAKFAAGYLRKQKDTFFTNNHARPNLEAAARHYDRIVELLTPAMTDKGPESYERFIGNLEKQKVHAKVLEQVKSELAAAAEEMVLALKAEGVSITHNPVTVSGINNAEKTMKLKVKRENGKVWIEGVRGFDACEYDSSVHGSQARILQTIGESLSYDDLICYSGFAFRVGFHETNCPSAGHPCCGYMCIENGARALPWKFKLFEVPKGGKQHGNQAAFEAEARAAIKASIDRGIPVHYGSEEDGLIIGYGEEGRRWWCVHPYHKNGTEAFWYDEATGFAGGKDKWPWGIAVLTEPKSKEERVSNRDLTIAALKQAADMWKTEKRGAYFVGDAAYAFWLKWLRDVEAGTVKDPKAGMHGNGWCFEVLIHSRRIAGRWLKQTADDFTGETGRQLRIAADHYTQLVEVCMKDINSPWDLAPGPVRFDAWTSRMRQQEIARLEAAREHDRAAIDAITQALAAEGVKVEPIKNEKPLIPSSDFPTSAMLKDIPTGKGNSNSYARGLATLLTTVGTPADYDRIMAGSGQAFITQSQLGEPLIDGAVDVGWWPLDSWGIDMRLEFLSYAVGREIRRVNGDPYVYKINPALIYRQRFDQEVKAAITAGKPVLAQIEPWFVAAGYDEKDPPLLGNCSLQEKKETTRIPEYPWALVLAGNKIEPMSQKIADLETLRYAVALARDNAADPTGIVPGCPVRQVHPTGQAQFTGQKSFTLWAKALRDMDHLGQARWHANMCFQLGINRRSAVAYLRDTTKRFPEKTAQHLTAAAALYEKALTELAAADTSEPAMKSKKGREKLAQLAERLAVLEAQAAEQLEQALNLEGVKVPALKAHSQEDNPPASANAKPQVKGIPFRPWQNMFITQVTCLKPCLEHLGIKISLPWLYGATGRAFMINIHETLCPSGWYVADPEEEVYRLGKNLGFTVEHLAGSGIGPDQPGFTEKQKEVWDKTRQALDTGLPCYTFDLGVCDYQPIYGYDDVGYYYSPGNAKEGTGPFPWQDLGHKGHLPVLYMDIVHPGTAAEDRKTLKDTFDFVIKFANKKTDPKNPYMPGLAAYDRWIAAFELGKATGEGAAYNAACYAEARTNAVAFLKEAMSRMPAELNPRFTQAIAFYQITADNLKRLSELFPFPRTSDKDVKKPDSVKLAVQYLHAAKDAEQKGLMVLTDLANALASHQP
jgi:beta-lactamase regulating signal transducer with metallopeptidase domain